MNDRSGHETPIQITAHEINTNPPTWQATSQLTSTATSYSQTFNVVPDSGSFPSASVTFQVTASDGDGTCGVQAVPSGPDSTSLLGLAVTITPPQGHPNLGAGLNIKIVLTYSVGDPKGS